MENTLEKLLAPVKELNELTLKTIEQIADLQVKAIQENSKISINSLKSANQISDFESLQEYLKEQIAVAQNISTTATENAQKVAKLGEAYANSVKSLVEKSVAAS